MRKTLFTRYFSVCAAIIMLTVVALGMMLIVLTAQYFKNDKLALMRDNAQEAAVLALSNSQISDNRLLIDKSQVVGYFSLLSNAISADVYMVDRSSGETLVCSHKAPCNHTAYLVPEEILKTVEETGSYQEMGRLGGIYSENYYTVGVPMKVGGTTLAVVFASSSADMLQHIVTQMIKLFLLSSVIVLMATFVILYFVTQQLVRPLREMLAATQSFAKGDFTVRVPIERYDEIGKLAMAFNNMASSLAAQEATSRSFVANVSHELKTPMTTISGFIDGILDGTIPREKHEQYLGIVSQEVKRLSRLVRSMLGIARIEAGEMKLVPTDFDIVEIVCRTVFTFEQQIEQKNLEVRGLDSEKVIVTADKDLIHQVVYNLVENAVKFANEGGYIEVAFSNEGGQVYVSVINSGEGLSREELPKVFERFYKTDRSRSSDKNGVGLGLHIVRSILNLHGGEINVRSVQGESCEFRFCLPAAKNASGKTTQSLFRKTEKK